MAIGRSCRKYLEDEQGNKMTIDKILDEIEGKSKSGRIDTMQDKNKIKRLVKKSLIEGSSWRVENLMFEVLLDIRELLIELVKKDLSSLPHHPHKPLKK